MAWSYAGASRSGVTFTVTIHNDDTPRLLKQMVYTKRANQTVPQFKAMVNREVRAVIDQLNAVELPVDASGDFNP